MMKSKWTLAFIGILVMGALSTGVSRADEGQIHNVIQKEKRLVRRQLRKLHRFVAEQRENTGSGTSYGPVLTYAVDEMWVNSRIGLLEEEINLFSQPVAEFLRQTTQKLKACRGYGGLGLNCLDVQLKAAIDRLRLIGQ